MPNKQGAILFYHVQAATQHVGHHVTFRMHWDTALDNHEATVIAANDHTTLVAEMDLLYVGYREGTYALYDLLISRAQVEYFCPQCSQTTKGNVNE